MNGSLLSVVSHSSQQVSEETQNIFYKFVTNSQVKIAYTVRKT